jgi:hypothetical protein
LQMSVETPKTRTIQFYLDIQCKGPLAFEKLKQAISVCGYHELLSILQPLNFQQHPSLSDQTRGLVPLL